MRITILSLRREVKVAMLVALVAGVGALGIHYGLRESGIGLCVMAAAIASQAPPELATNLGLAASRLRKSASARALSTNSGPCTRASCLPL